MLRTWRQRTLHASSKKSRAAKRRVVPSFELLETRLTPVTFNMQPQFVLNTAAPQATPQVGSYFNGSLANAFTPAHISGRPDISKAYGFDQIPQFNSAYQNGYGQTIAIIDAYHDPNIVSDLNQFDSFFHIDPPPSFTQVDLTKVNPNDTSATGSGGYWQFEEALDVEWAHAMAPGANIVLIECADADQLSLIGSGTSTIGTDTGIKQAVNNTNATVVAMSFGAPEWSEESGKDTKFNSPGTNPNGITFVAASGQTPGQGLYPAFSPNVLAVGGTNLSLDSNSAWQSETPWNRTVQLTNYGSAGGTSQYEIPAPLPGDPGHTVAPTWQTTYYDSTLTTRAIPDVAAVADTTPGLLVYDSYPVDSKNNSSSAGWLAAGGSSFGCNIWAGLIAVANQSRVAAATVPIYSASESGTTVTLTTNAPNTFVAGQTVTVAGAPAGYNGRFTIPPGGATPTTIQYDSGGPTNLTAVSGLGGANITLATLDGPSQTMLGLYEMSHNTPSPFHTITIGRNSTTGLGSPIAPQVVEYLTDLPDTNGLNQTQINNRVTHFSVTGAPSQVLAGSPFNVVVTALDAQGNVVHGFTGLVKLTSTDTQASLPGVFTFTSADNGSHTFSVTLNTGGNFAVTAARAFNIVSASADSGSGTSTITTAQPHIFTGSAQVTITGNAISSYAGNNNPFIVQYSPPGLYTFDVAVASGFPGSGAGGVVTGNSVTGSVTILSIPLRVTSLIPTPTGFTATFNEPFQPGALALYGGAAIATATDFGGTVTITTTSPHGLSVGRPVTIAGVSVGGYNGTFTITAASPTTFQYTASSGLASGTGGSVNLAYQTDIATATDASGTVTITTKSAHRLSVGQSVYIAGVSNGGYNGTFTVTAVPSPTTFKYTVSSVLTSGTGGSVYPDTESDVSLVGSNLGWAIPGSIVIDPTNTSLTFKILANTLDFINNVLNGGPDSVVLPDDTYKVTLISGAGASGFLNVNAYPLDGASNNGTANYTTTFTTHYQANAIPVLGIPDFSRGPDSNSTIQVPNDTAHGIPVTLYNASSVTDVTFTLNYNPQLLTPTGGGTVDATDPAKSTFTMGTIGNSDSTHSYVTFTFTFRNGTAPSGNVVLGDILASVPNSAISQYKAVELLQLCSITVNGSDFSNIYGVTAPGLHVNAYFGDVSADRILDFKPSITVISGSVSGTTVTIVATNSLAVGDWVYVTGVSISGYNGLFQVTGAGNGTSFSYTVPTALGPANFNNVAIHSGNDLIGMYRVAIGLWSGFQAYSLIDPAIIGDVAGDISVDGGDYAYLMSYLLGLPRNKIPTPP